MTTSRARVLKAADVASQAIISVPNRVDDEPGVPIAPDTPVRASSENTESAPVYDLATVEQMCRQARADGAAQAAAGLEPTLGRLADAMRDLAASSAEAQAAAAQADAERVVDVALEISRWILGRELSEPRILLDLVERAVAAGGGQTVTRIRLHPDLTTLLAEVAPGSVSIAADGALAPGEFVCEADGPDISFRFADALDRARDALLAEAKP